MKSLDAIFNDEKKSLDDIFGGTQKEESGYFKNLVGGVKEDINKRAGEITTIADEYGAGKKNLAESAFQVGAKGISGLWDIAGRATPEFIKEPVMSGFSALAKSKPIQAVAESKPIQFIAEKYLEFEKENPNKVDNIKAFGEYLSVLPAKKAASVSTKATESAIKGTAKVTGEAIKPIVKNAGKALETAEKIGQFGTSQFTGLSPKTIRKLIDNPQAVTKAEKAGLDRAMLANKVETGIKERLEDLSALGKEYNHIRKSDEVVKIKSNPFAEVMNKYNIGFDNGKIIRTKKTKLPLKEGDTKAIEEFGYLFGTENRLTAEEFLNARRLLDDMAKWDNNKSDASKIISRDLRKRYDDIGKDQIKGLKSLDNAFSEEIRELSQIKRDYIDSRTGKLKDGAANKIANLTGTGKDQILGRLEKIIPGITEEINILKVLEDIESIKGIKVGTYTRGAIGGFATTGGNPAGALIGAILSAPEVAVPLIKNYGIAKQISKSVVDNIVQKMKSGIDLLKSEKKIVDDAIKDYSGKINKIESN